MITELVYSPILNINIGSILYRKFQAYVHLSIPWLLGSKKFPGPLRNRPLDRILVHNPSMYLGGKEELFLKTSVFPKNTLY